MSHGLLTIVLTFGLWFFLGASEGQCENSKPVPSLNQFDSANPPQPGSTTGPDGGLLKAAATKRAFYLLVGVSALLVFLIPVTLYGNWTNLKYTERWADRLNEDRSAMYRQNPGAMRLVGASAYMAEPLAPLRTIDPVYDVQPRKIIETHHLRFKPLAVFLVLGLGLLAQSQITNLHQHRQLLIDWGPYLAFGFWGIVILMVVYTLFTREQERRPEGKVSTDSFFIQSNKTAFHQYHDRVLEELGFRKLKSCLCTKHRISFVYVSQRGNLLVELVQHGFAAGKDYFSMATVTNDGKFLETHSALQPKHEQRDLNLRWQRRSASHEDFIRALAEHEQMVVEFTQSGSVQEAQFTEERFEAFLRWGAEKNAI